MEFEYLKQIDTWIATNVQFPCEVVITKVVEFWEDTERTTSTYNVTMFVDEGSSPVVGKFPTITDAIRFAEVHVPFEFKLGVA